MRKKGLAILMAVMMAVQPAAVSAAAQEGAVTERLSFEDVNLSDSEELLQSYLDQQLTAGGENSLSAESARVSLGLTGWEKKFYDALKKKIAAVAAGKVSSTSFFISYAELGLKESYTAAELTKASGIKVNAIAYGYQLTSSAKKAINQLMVGDMDLVLKTLLADYPYELYWFDKTAGISYTSAGYNYNSSAIKVDLSEGITCSFAVAADYAAGYYTTNDRPARVAQAVSNAKKIVAKYKKKSDYEKLVAYKNEICNRVSYNTAAASSYYAAFGDPWQLIYVLDNDTSNKVVCEGYSKAFKYLCDLTSFSADVSCYLVSGVMSTGGGSGSHMWNIVRVNKKSFLVDVTNCDGESASSHEIGYPDKLFLQGIVKADGDSGSVSAGYWIQANGKSVGYFYDSDQSTLYGKDVLTLADHDAAKSDFTKTSTAASKVTLSKTKITLKKGKTYQISAKVTPSSCTQKIQYSTSDKSVATVSSKGLVKAKKKGTAKITVKVGTKKAVLSVKVK